MSWVVAMPVGDDTVDQSKPVSPKMPILAFFQIFSCVYTVILGNHTASRSVPYIGMYPVLLARILVEHDAWQRFPSL